MNDLKIWIRKIPLHVWILLLIVAVGIFLRTYHFRDWLVFNPDQARDATVIGNILEGKKSWLMLGPEAGNTLFDLGPWFYHLEAISAKIFGNAPDKLAYPDLLFSILAIPLFYIFLKKYFKRNLSLLLTFFLSISYFMIFYSRFASNPNSIPFFSLLFFLGLLMLLDSKEKRVAWGAALAGIGIGVGLQLHILILFVMPAVVFLFFLNLFLRKAPIAPLVKKTLMILFFALIANIGQIAYEANHNHSNTNRFLKAFSKNAQSNNWGQDIEITLLCQAEANLHILASTSTGDNCEYPAVLSRILASRVIGVPLGQADRDILLEIAVGLLFTLGGYVLLVYFWRVETDPAKKRFLALVGAYAAVTFFVMVPIIGQAALRYYIVIFFLPFVFLGLWTKLLWGGRNGKEKYFFGAALIAIFALIAYLQYVKIGSEYTKHKEMSFSDTRFVALDEAEVMAKYVAENTLPQKKAYISGKVVFFSRYFKPVSYLAKKQYGIKIERGLKESKMKDDIPMFFFKKPVSAYQIKSRIIMGREAKGYKMFNNVAIVKF